jgi:hypothetical protein
MKRGEKFDFEEANPKFISPEQKLYVREKVAYAKARSPNAATNPTTPAYNVVCPLYH